MKRFYLVFFIKKVKKDPSPNFQGSKARAVLFQSECLRRGYGGRGKLSVICAEGREGGCRGG